jgi:hypothetical protein
MSTIATGCYPTGDNTADTAKETWTIAENNLRAQLGAGSVSKNSNIDLIGEVALPRSRKCE